MNDFNRGLKQGIALGELKERERIIKLLEERMKTLENLVENVRTMPERYNELEKAFALIKGENK